VAEIKLYLRTDGNNSGENKKPGFIIDIRYSREEVPGTAPQKYEK
jgi:hypothetical protein